MKSLKQKLLENGVKEKDIDNWCSDLYVKITKKSKEVIKNYQFKNSVETFKSEIDGTLWYDVPFAFWEVKK